MLHPVNHISIDHLPGTVLLAVVPTSGISHAKAVILQHLFDSDLYHACVLLDLQVDLDRTYTFRNSKKVRRHSG
jgi:hypothetical protein